MKQLRLFFIFCLSVGSFTFADDTIEQTLSCYVNGHHIGEVTAKVTSAEDGIILDKKAITPELKGKLNRNGERIFGLIVEKDLTLIWDRSFTTKSITFKAVQETQQLRLLIPPHLLEGKGLSNTSINYEEEIYQYPASRSFYVNLMAGEKIIHNYFVLEQQTAQKNAAQTNIDSNTMVFSSPPKNETFANFDMVANLNQLVAQGYFYYVASQKTGINRGNIVVSRDFEERDLRLSAGNINYMTMGFENSIPLFGLNLSKNKQIFTNPVMGPLSRHEFFLNAPSRIDVYIDNVYSTTLEVPAGPLLVSSFPIIQGLNNVRLKITGAAGEQITLDLNTFFLAELLKKGEDTYALTLGIPTFNNAESTTSYQWNKPTVSMMYRRGFADVTTIGGYFQAQLNQAYAGLQFVQAVGDVKGMLDLALSKYTDFPVSFRGRLQLSPHVPSGEKPPIYKWKLVFDAMSRHFGYLGTKPGTPQPLIYSAGGSIGRDLPNDANINFIFNLSALRPNPKLPKRTVALTTEIQFQQRMYKDFVAKINASIKTINSKPEHAILFAFDYAPKDGKTKFSSSYNTQQQLALLSASKTFGFSGDRSLTLAAGATHAPKAWNATGSVNYQGTFLEALGNHYIAKSSTINPDSTLGVSFFSVGSSLVYADGVFAITRPVTDSFIIVMPENRRDNLFVVNPSPDGDYIASSNRTGRVVLSKVQSYKPFDVETSAPGGTKLGQHHRTIYPRYKSGTVVKVHKEPLYTFRGRIIADGKSVAPQDGELIHAHENPPRVWAFEVLKDGSFVVDDLPAGDYILLLDHYSLQEAYLHVVAPESGTVIHFGDIEIHDAGA